jgi:hypothetical protein
MPTAALGLFNRYAQGRLLERSLNIHLDDLKHDDLAFGQDDLAARPRTLIEAKNFD